MKSHNYKMLPFGLLLLALGAGFWQSTGSAERGGGLVSRTNDPRRHFTLSADDYWRLSNSKKDRFDASGLLLRNGQLLTLSDRGPELFEIVPGTNHSAELRSTPFFPSSAVAKAARVSMARFDCEGIAADPEGNLYICEESQRRIYRSSPDGSIVELPLIDWTSVKNYFRGGINASFEGVAVGRGKLYVANEREAARIIVVDLPSLTVEDSFFVDSAGFALGGPHYSDLCFFDGKLFVLDRNHRCILEVDPSTKKVTAEYSFGTMELQEDFAYFTDYPTGTMEGLAVDTDFFWLVTDNNGRGRIKDRDDFRPTLFRCKRPSEK
jgi:uncharacterized protein YjiK